MQKIISFRYLILFITVIFFTNGCDDKRNDPLNKLIELDKKNRYVKYSAYYTCQNTIKKNLKSPSTAEFASYLNSKVYGGRDNVWYVKSYVDAQNSFGATIRKHYECAIQFSKDETKYTIKSINFQ